MAEKVFTYLLGAGASYHAVPLVNEFVNGRKRIIKTINDIPQIKIILPGLKDFVNEISKKIYGKIYMLIIREKQ